jgi:hypothetical protein
MYKAFILLILFFSMNLGAQNSSESTLFSSKKKFQEKVGWILNVKSSKFKKDSRSRALDTQADSIYFSYSFEGEEYSDPIRYYFTYENVAGMKRPSEMIYADGYDEEYNFRFEMNYNDQGLNTGGNIYFDAFNSNQNIGYYEQRFDSKGFMIYHIVDINIPGFGTEYYGDSLAITYNAQNLESTIRFYNLDYDTDGWLLTEDFSDMQYNNDSQLVSFEWHNYYHSGDSVEVTKRRLENIIWFSDYSLDFILDIIEKESIIDELSPDQLFPSVYQEHKNAPIHYNSFVFIDGEWTEGFSVVTDSISQNYLSLIFTEEDNISLLVLTFNDEGYVLTQKNYSGDPQGNLLYEYGAGYDYNDFNLPVSERFLYSEDESIFEEYFAASYEIDDQQRLLSFEAEYLNSFQDKSKGEYFYSTGVSTSALQLQNDAVKLFPNPVECKMTIKSELDIIKPMHYQIISPDGRTLMNGVFEGDSQNEINVSALPSGIYFFKWQMAEKYGSQRIVKM